MSKKPIIAVDIDDVLADTTEVLRVFVNKKYGYNLEKYHYHAKTGTYWGHYEKIWENHDINGDGIIDEFHAVYVEDQSHVPALEGALDTIKTLHNRFGLIAISSRSTDMQKATEQWVTRVFEGQFDSVLCIDNGKKLSITKGEACKAAGASFLIDDNIGHCKSALEHGVQPILFGDYGWHDGQKIDGIESCKDWQEVAEYFSNEYSG